MTGREAFEQAMRLLNYTDSYGDINGAKDAALFQRARALLNSIYADLFYTSHGPEEVFPELTDINEVLQLNDRIAQDVLPYGLAMLLAGSEGDGTNQAIFSRLYNAKRPSAAVRTMRRTNVLPTPEG